MDGVAFHLRVLAEEGSRQSIHPVHGLAGRSGSHRAFAAYWASIPSKAGWERLIAEFPADAKTLRHTFTARNVMDEYKEGKIFIRKTPVKQSIETWNEAWTEFKSA